MVDSRHAQHREPALVANGRRELERHIANGLGKHRHQGSTTYSFTQPNLLYLFKVISVPDAATGPIAFPEDAEAPDCVVKHCYRLVKPRHRARISVRSDRPPP
jgi:hypothetical protein